MVAQEMKPWSQAYVTLIPFDDQRSRLPTASKCHRVRPSISSARSGCISETSDGTFVRFACLVTDHPDKCRSPYLSGITVFIRVGITEWSKLNETCPLCRATMASPTSILSLPTSSNASSPSSR
ncbi:hypothetical protein M569_06968 [Genlisea aurea]|uniref:Uncharacterized protein n=1 Tax=Genlisea aurea TaxID=192259 RepID=S8DX21_9LAMI|nr:hypothetical protein M569_06968 [Genlisea aurea]